MNTNRITLPGRLILLLVFIIFKPFSASSQHKDNHYRLPADWEKQESIWIRWSDDKSLLNIQKSVVKSLIPYIQVSLVVDADSIYQDALGKLIVDSIDTKNVHELVVPGTTEFLRSQGPVFVYDQNNRVTIAEFKWNHYGITGDSLKENRLSKINSISPLIADKLKLPVIKSDLVLEAGSFVMSNEGLLLVSLELMKDRNPDKDLFSLINELKRMLGAQKIIWLGTQTMMERNTIGPRNANIFANGLRGHIDNYIRFANDSTILVSMPDSIERKFDPISSADYLTILENVNILRKITGVNDQPLKIVEVPVPVMRFHFEQDTITQDDLKIKKYHGFEPGDIYYKAADLSYLNYIITNGVVLIPQYYHDGLTDSELQKDQDVKALFEQLFPERKIIQVNPEVLNLVGSGLYRFSINEPARVKNKN